MSWGRGLCLTDRSENRCPAIVFQIVCQDHGNSEGEFGINLSGPLIIGMASWATWLVQAARGGVGRDFEGSSTCSVQTDPCGDEKRQWLRRGASCGRTVAVASPYLVRVWLVWVDSRSQ